jgi:hypothetical protein
MESLDLISLITKDQKSQKGSRNGSPCTIFESGPQMESLDLISLITLVVSLWLYINPS